MALDVIIVRYVWQGCPQLRIANCVNRFVFWTCGLRIAAADFKIKIADCRLRIA